MTATAFKTLVEMLAYRARTTPEATAFTYLDTPCRYGKLWQRASRTASLLHQRGLRRGDHVVLLLPNGSEFFYAFYGVLLAGGVAVPVFPGSGAGRIGNIARVSDSRVIIRAADITGRQLDELAEMCRQEGLSLVAVSENTDTATAELPTVSPDDVAYIQYTSGSTGDPKGVQLSHRNLLVNCTQLISGMRITPQEVFVSWLPVYHDMGLVLKTLVPFYLGCRLYLLPTRLTDVHLWLGTIHNRRATFTAAPDFAYRLLLRYITDPGQYDLSSLRVALNAAEPVRVSTLQGFENRFGLKNVMVAGYGLAEATVGVSMWPPQSGNRIDRHGNVSVGPPFEGVRVRIRRAGKRVQPGAVGEVTLHSPANTRGYYRNPDASRRLFLEDGFIATGDSGYVDAAGNLFIVGRLKNMMIVSGRSLAPREIEEIVDAAQGVRFSAAVGIDGGRIEGEQVFVFVEVRDRVVQLALEEKHKMAVKLVDGIHRGIGIRPARLFFVRPGAIPLTHNGKVRHQHLKHSYTSGKLRQDGAIVFPDY